MQQGTKFNTESITSELCLSGVLERRREREGKVSHFYLFLLVVFCFTLAERQIST